MYVHDKICSQIYALSLFCNWLVHMSDQTEVTQMFILILFHALYD